MNYAAPASSIGGTFAAQPQGCILHGSRSGHAEWTIGQETFSTATYAANGANGLGWNVTVGEGVYCVHIDPRHWGWNAYGASQRYLAVEFAQATVDKPITDGQVAAFVAWWRRFVRPVWPDLDLTAPGAMPAHSELPEGIKDGKTDTFPRGDPRNDDLRARIVARLRKEMRAIQDDNDRMEALYQQRQAALGDKRFAGYLRRPFYQGAVLVCQRGVVTPGGLLDAQGQVDDLVTLWEAAGVLIRYGQPP